MHFEAQVEVIGSGLAGSEAAFFLANKGVRVRLVEMRPRLMTPAHHTHLCAELVCSNSLKSQAAQSAPGMLKAEMRHLGSLILQCAEKAAVPGGEALAVDRMLFSQSVTDAISHHPLIERVTQEVTQPEGQIPTLIATGPLSSPALSQWIAKATAQEDLYFYDAIAPIIDASSLNRDVIFAANRYDKGEEVAYLNCPFEEEQYYRFIDALLAAEKVPPKNFEKEYFFQGCQPIEAIAAGGKDSLRFGPMKPVGLENPKLGRRSFAVVQLRPENRALTAYNIVGFQTKLKYGEQSKVFRMIPGLEQAEFLRLGSIHRNTYVCGPKVLNPDLSLKRNPLIYLAGQITGVEGYLESSACGLLSAIFILERLKRIPHSAPPANTALGALLRHIVASGAKHYQPSNIHFGLFDPAFFEGVEGLKREAQRECMATQTPLNFKKWWEHQPLSRQRTGFLL